ncbi:RES family NAD+ phosphorylase [Emticicia oligotrophica]|uniref:RES family NAD+ phosphorylase n=1 Tax=Emticicia oligotrophica TaxID=312279 RepID=UPI00273CDF6C|nr:RES family NAD+ phosphorylase [Emticicia oligotrophica]
MEVFRLSSAKYANDLSGTGAKIHGGRWNRKGDAVLYTAGTRALALVEVLVHTTNAFLPLNYRLITIYIPDDSILTIPTKSLPDDWNNTEPSDSTTKISTSWLSTTEYLTMRVPSVVVEGEYNFLINPAHPDFSKIKVLRNEAFNFDNRLMKQK